MDNRYNQYGRGEDRSQRNARDEYGSRETNVGSRAWDHMGEDEMNRSMRDEREYSDQRGYQSGREFGSDRGSLQDRSRSSNRMEPSNFDVGARERYGAGESAENGSFWKASDRRDDLNRGSDYGRASTYGSYGDFERGRSGSQSYNDSNRGSFYNERSGVRGGYGGDTRTPQISRERGFSSSMGYGGGLSPQSQNEGSTYRMDGENRGFGNYDHRSQSYMGEGQFMGRGPRGYQRSDERIREDVCETLTRNPYVDATDIEVAVQDRIVTLRGTVPERRMKRIAEDVIENLSGVQDIHNEIKVKSEGFFSKVADSLGLGEKSDEKTNEKSDAKDTSMAKTAQKTNAQTASASKAQSQA